MKVIGTASPNSPAMIRGRQRRCASIFNGSSVANMLENLGLCDGRPARIRWLALHRTAQTRDTGRVCQKRSAAPEDSRRCGAHHVGRSPGLTHRRLYPSSHSKALQCRLERRHQSYGFRETPSGRIVPHTTRDQWRQARQRARSHSRSTTELSQSIDRQNECLGHQNIVGKRARLQTGEQSKAIGVECREGAHLYRADPKAVEPRRHRRNSGPREKSFSRPGRSIRLSC